jgi:replicative DNA helicase
VGKEYYDQMRKPLESNREKFEEWLAEGNRVEGKAEVIIGKQRHGPTARSSCNSRPQSPVLPISIPRIGLTTKA